MTTVTLAEPVVGGARDKPAGTEALAISLQKVKTAKKSVWIGHQRCRKRRSSATHDRH